MGHVPAPRAPSRSIGARTPEQFEPQWRGERIIDRMAFWSAFGFVGALVNNWLADKLDECSQWLEDYLVTRTKPAGPYSAAERDHIRARQRNKGTPLPALPPTGGSGVKLAAPEPTCECGCIAGTCRACAGVGHLVGVPYTKFLEFGRSPPPEPMRFEHRDTLGNMRHRWYCGACNRYFPDGALAHSHACVMR